MYLLLCLTVYEQYRTDKNDQAHHEIREIVIDLHYSMTNREKEKAALSQHAKKGQTHPNLEAMSF